MTGIKVDAVHFAKQGLRSLGSLLSCKRPWPNFLECGPKEKLCETLGLGTTFPTLTPNVRCKSKYRTAARRYFSAGTRLQSNTTVLRSAMVNSEK